MARIAFEMFVNRDKEKLERAIVCSKCASKLKMRQHCSPHFVFTRFDVECFNCQRYTDLWTMHYCAPEIARLKLVKKAKKEGATV